jgi:hypothetical protein
LPASGAAPGGQGRPERAERSEPRSGVLDGPGTAELPGRSRARRTPSRRPRRAHAPPRRPTDAGHGRAPTLTPTAPPPSPAGLPSPESSPTIIHGEPEMVHTAQSTARDLNSGITGRKTRITAFRYGHGWARTSDVSRVKRGSHLTLNWPICRSFRGKYGIPQAANVAGFAGTFRHLGPRKRCAAPGSLSYLRPPSRDH